MKELKSGWEITKKFCLNTLGGQENNVLGFCTLTPLVGFRISTSWLDSAEFPAIRPSIYFHLSASNFKRILKSSSSDFDLRLTDCLNRILKKRWIVREPVSRHQWTFLLGSNWKKFPEFRKMGFYNLGSRKGKEILSRLIYTAEELRREHERKRQLFLPFISGVLKSS